MSRVASTNKDFFRKFAQLVNNPEQFGGRITNPGRSLTAVALNYDSPLWRVETGYLNSEQRRNFEAALITMGERGPVVVGYSYDTPIYMAQCVDGVLDVWEVEGKFSVTTSRHHSGYRMAV